MKKRRLVWVGDEPVFVDVKDTGTPESIEKAIRKILEAREEEERRRSKFTVSEIKSHF